MNRKQKHSLYRILVSALLLCLVSAAAEGPVALILYLAVYMLIGYDILRKAILGIVNSQIFDENFLMAAATVGALLLGEYTEAVAVMLFYQIGELFESVAVGKSRRSIAALMDIRPQYANVPDASGELIQTDPEDVAPGSVIVVLPGERLPIDGIILEGESSLDCSALTGESMPKDVRAGDEALSGSVNLSGLLKIRTSRHFEESTVSRILELVESAAGRKSRSESFIARFARVYTPAVCFSAVALALLPPLFSLFAGQAANWSQWLYRALSFLVISCPCALVISVPLSFFAGIGGAGREGILIKGSNYLEQLSMLKCIVFDKTGTLTSGTFELDSIIPENVEADELLELAAHVESASGHPIAKSIVSAFRGQIDSSRLGQVKEVGGFGLQAELDGDELAVGSRRLMEVHGIELPSESPDGGCVYVQRNGVYLGCILLRDRVKSGAAEAVRKLRSHGVENIVMLTGDSFEAARAVASELGIDEFYASLLPGDKVEKVEELLKRLPAGGRLAFVGDGINDAPVLSRADIGVAMGALGSDAAIEASDVVLMDDDPRKLSKAVGISAKCMKIVRQNIVCSIGIKLVFLLMTALGLSNMWFAIFADVGVMVLAVLNSVRMLNVKSL